MSELPEYYFRVRENGAFVFRVDAANRQRRIDMDQIAVVNVKTGQVKAHGERQLSDADLAAIEAWVAERREMLAYRTMDDIYRAVDMLNQTAHWATSSAQDHELEEVSGTLLLAMHDLRAVLVRKKSERMLKAKKAALEGE